MMSRRRQKRGNPIDGVLLLDKQQGITSNKALQQCRYLINAQKGGHTGALDPLATGLLPLCFGQATKISSFLLDSGKTYAVGATLGETTDTGDADGKIIETSQLGVTQAQIEAVLASFVGEYAQVPPMYSALKQNGQPLYKLARQGIEVERKARQVTAYDIRFNEFEGNTLVFEVDCSSGFYVRSLVEDIGRELGCGAHVKTLRRKRIGKLDIRDAVTADEFEAVGTQEARIAMLMPADRLLENFPAVSLDVQQSTDLKHGRLVSVAGTDELRQDQWIRIYGSEGVFLGLGQMDKQGKLAPKRLFV